ncbi:MAG: serine hydrolase [Cyclobacteriaceae bacterium]|nr:serine hydrolase [Cyclobacteriaceae bacterium]
MKKVCLLVVISLLAAPALAQTEKTIWVDSVFRTLTLREQVGQLIMLRAPAPATPEALLAFERHLRTWRPGSVWITAGTPVRHVNTVNFLQTLTPVPLLVAMDAEYGPGQTLDSLIRLPPPIVLGALKNDSLVGAVGFENAKLLRQLGVHITFAPQADVDVPTTHNRFLSYLSNDKFRVARKAVAYANGLQQGGVMAVATHAHQAVEPATVDTAVQINTALLDTLGFYPYIELIRHGIGGVLTSYLHFTSVEKKNVIPAPVSTVVINDFLKQKLGFRGLTFADVPTVAKLTAKARPGEAALLALEAGHDVLMNPGDPSVVVKKLSKAIKRNKKLRDQVAASAKKILEAKYEAGLSQSRLVDRGAAKTLGAHRPAARLAEEVFEQAITVVNQTQELPITWLDNRTFVSVTIGTPEEAEPWERYLKKYVPLQTVHVTKPADTTALPAARAEAVFLVSVYPSAEHLATEVLARLAKRSRMVYVCHFGNPFLLDGLLPDFTLLAGYQATERAAKATAQILFGALPARGELPVRTNVLPAGLSLATTPLQRLGFALPEATGMSSDTLARIDAIAEEAIAMGATPGCHVLVAHKGKVVFEKSYGWLTYDKRIRVSDETVYDLASITKVAATLQAIMFLYDRGLIDIHKKASYYLPELKNSNKKDYTLKDILTHQAGLWPFLPFWAETVKDTLHTFYYRAEPSPDFPFPVADNLFASKAMKDSLWSWIVKAKVREKPVRTPHDYRYSDMGFYLLHRLAEKFLNQPMEEFLEQNLYEPLGAGTLGYLPRTRFDAACIAPTEDDTLFRKSLLIGYVHDQGAAMHGGIAGHAGLFGTARDLAKLGQMLLQKGRYGGMEYYRPETVDLFTRRQYANSRRALGWDGPLLGDKSNPVTERASSLTFGHTGFTGTCLWVDPAAEVVYVFLSNRVHPNMNNAKLLTANIRPRIQDVVYRAIKKQ